MAALSITRAEKEKKRRIGVRASRGPGGINQCPPTAQSDPGGSRVCRPRSSESALRIPPPREAARCRHVSHAARIAAPLSLANKPGVLSAVSACRRSSGQRPPAALVHPGLSAPKRKARSQEAGCRPRRLRWQSNLHCLLTVPAAAESPSSAVQAGLRPCCSSTKPPACARRCRHAAAAIHHERYHHGHPLLHVRTVIPRAAGVPGAPPSAPPLSDAHAAQACFALGSSRSSCFATCQELRGSRLRFPQTKASIPGAQAPQPPCHSLVASGARI